MSRRKRIDAIPSSPTKEGEDDAEGEGEGEGGMAVVEESEEQFSGVEEAEEATREDIEAHLDEIFDGGTLLEAERKAEEEGEDLMDGLEKDYKAVPEWDHYDPAILDEGDYGQITFAQREAAENALKKRDKRQRRSGSRLPTALLGLDDDDSDEDEEERARRAPRRRRMMEQAATGEVPLGLDFNDDGEAFPQEPIDLEDRRLPLREWISQPQCRAEIARRFKIFFQEFVDAGGSNVYHQRIGQMCSQNRESLEVSFLDLSTHQPTLAIWLADCPTEMLQIFDEVAMKAVLSSHMFSGYAKIHASVHVRITHVPITDNLRDVRQVHLNALIKVRGVVTRRTGVFPQLALAMYECVKCKNTIGPLLQSPTRAVKPSSCDSCSSKGPFIINGDQTVYRNYQKLTLQESPGSVPPGRLPRTKDVILLWDLIDQARPGEEIEVTGIYRNNFDMSLNCRNGFPVFATVIEANFLSKKNDVLSSFNLNEEDVRKIRELSRDRRIGDKIINSIAPSIYGHQDIKTALALSLFAGQSKQIGGKHRIRGDINVLLLGDPGKAKSQFLKYVETVSPRAVYTTGQGASAVGLTAAVRLDPVTREWTLEGGALVLADRGICLIDEFDKMSDKDRTSIHEAMEQQSISISKAGIVCTLQARSAVIAAANPVRGRYDPSVSFSQNVDLTEPILSRFDILCVVRDIVDGMEDEKLAKFVVQSHMRSHPDFEGMDVEGMALFGTGGTNSEEDETISQDLLRKYLIYSKMHCFPKLSNINRSKIPALYAEMRKESQVGGGIPMGVRHVESMLRISEAYARMHLRDYVTEEDVNVAIRVMLESFIQSQKRSVQTKFRNQFRRYITYRKDDNELLYFILQNLVRETTTYLKIRHDVDAPPQVEVPCLDFESRAREVNIMAVNSFYKSKQFSRDNFVLDVERRVIVKTFG
eukprot:TRINITY_DN1195_c0_g1_i1.p1 TRINITY_DN1195_c0_g1~~TRINITY_DN1195_c0_g1_i1.p1  ORF type:complete len:930 (-),score=205.41 TRINITY_DN1195_c0_g1_i1:4-2793(-)